MSDCSIKAERLSIEFPTPAVPAGQSDDGELASAARFVTRGGRSYLRAIDKIDLQIEAGERVGIWGKNGSGKTTLLSTLRGVYPPSGGSLSIRGETQSFLNLAYGFNADASGFDNILIRGVLMGGTPDKMRAQVDSIADFSELGPYLSLPLRQYSAGMRMRLAFAIAMSLPSDILLMDEWISVGDIEFREKASEKLRDIVRQSKILVIASHSRPLLERLCNRVIVLDQGKIVSDDRL